MGLWSAEYSRRMGALSCFHAFIYRISLTSNKIYLEENLFIRNRAEREIEISYLSEVSCNIRVATGKAIFYSEAMSVFFMNVIAFRVAQNYSSYCKEIA